MSQPEADQTTEKPAKRAKDKGAIISDPEIASLGKMLKILTALDAGQRWRIIRYLTEKFQTAETVSADTMEK